MQFHRHERIVVLIDGLHLRSTERALGFHIDYNRLRARFQSGAHLLRIVYYSPLAAQVEEDPLRRLLDWLSYNGYQVVTRPARQFVDDEGKSHIRGNIRVALAVDAMDLAATTDHIVLIAGHGDFAYLVEALKRRGKRVTVLSSTRSVVADELRRQSDVFVEFETLMPDLELPAETTGLAKNELPDDAETAPRHRSNAEPASNPVPVVRRRLPPRPARDSSRGIKDLDE